MARKPDIQYIRFYTDGSAAKQLQPKQPREKKFVLSKVYRVKKRVIHLDPLAVAGIVVSCVMLILMVVGSIQLHTARQQSAQMNTYVTYLQDQNAELIAAYESGYDLAVVEKSALALGMIPAEQAKTITVAIDTEQQEEEPAVWDRICGFIEGLFA